MNKAILIGNLAADPELRSTSSGVPVCTLRLAVSRPFANQQGVRESDFFNVIVWRQQAENCARYLSKGRKVAVEGSIQTRSYDAQDGSKRYITEIVADRVEFLSSRSDSASQSPYDNPPPEAPAFSAGQPNRDDFTEIDDDELPF